MNYALITQKMLLLPAKTQKQFSKQFNYMLMHGWQWLA